MGHTPYYSDKHSSTDVIEQAGQAAEIGDSHNRVGHGAASTVSGDSPAGVDVGIAHLDTVAAGILNGISPLQFMDSIDTGNRKLGNRAFLHWVGQLHAGGQGREAHEIAAQGLQGSGRPLTHLDTLQRAFGRHDIRGMREHTGPAAELALEVLGAEGYMRGGRMAVAGSPDLYIQAHEAAHGVQQAALGDRMPLPDGIGVAGDQYEQQADAVADAVLRGESAQPLLDQVTAGPTQVEAASVCAAAPVQMRRKKDKKNKDNTPEDEYEHGMPTLEAASLELVNPVGNSDLSSPADGSMEIQQVVEALEDEAAGSSDEDTDADSDYEDETDEFMASYFPAVFAMYNWLTDRAEHIQTAEHGALSLPGTGNTLATVMLGISMVGIGLPLDIFTNMLGAMARCLMLMSDIFFGKPATWLLNSYFRRYPPSAADRARVTSDELPKGPPRGIDWNVSAPELIAVSGISAYWQAASAQASLSPRLWIQPWTAGRIASIVIRTIIDNIIYLLQFTVFPQFSRRVLQNRLRWGETRSGLFVAMLYNIFDASASYIISYLINAPLAIYLVFQNFTEENGMTSAEATAAFIGYAAVGMFIYIMSVAIFEHSVINRIYVKKLEPWLRQFRAIPNRLVRTIAIALASFRNVLIMILSTSLTTGQLSANIIGPLSTRFGQGGACIWPLAVAEVCGGLPDDFNETTLEKNIAVGEENLTFGQLFAIQLFPWLVGFIGIGAPIAYIIYQYRRARRAGRGADTADLEQSASVRQGSDSIVGEDAVPDIVPSLPEEIQASITENEGNTQHSVGTDSGSETASTGLTVQMLFELLIRQDRLTPTGLRRTLNQHVANSDITMEEAKLIEAMVREEVVLSKER